MNTKSHPQISRARLSARADKFYSRSQRGFVISPLWQSRKTTSRVNADERAKPKAAKATNALPIAKAKQPDSPALAENVAHHISRHIEADAPVQLVYDSWLRFCAFPHFMKGANACGSRYDFRMIWFIPGADNQVALEAEVCEQIPGERIAWRSVWGDPYPVSGAVHFVSVSGERTRVFVELNFGGPVRQWPGNPLPRAAQYLDWSLIGFRRAIETQVRHEQSRVMPLEAHA